MVETDKRVVNCVPSNKNKKTKRKRKEKNFATLKLGTWNAQIMILGFTDNLWDISDTRKTAAINWELSRLQIDIITLKETRLLSSSSIRYKLHFLLATEITKWDQGTRRWHCSQKQSARIHHITDRGNRKILPLQLHTAARPTLSSTDVRQILWWTQLRHQKRSWHTRYSFLEILTPEWTPTARFDLPAWVTLVMVTHTYTDTYTYIIIIVLISVFHSSWMPSLTLQECIVGAFYITPAKKPLSECWHRPSLNSAFKCQEHWGQLAWPDIDHIQMALFLYHKQKWPPSYDLGFVSKGLVKHII